MRHSALFLSLAATFSLAAPAAVAGEPASDAQLCRWQVELLISRDKLTEAEAASFKAQCDCLAKSESGQAESSQNACTREWTP